MLAFVDKDGVQHTIIDVITSKTRIFSNCSNCEFSHNPSHSTASYSLVGENLFRSGLTPSHLPNAATQAWFDEVKLCYIGDDCLPVCFKIFIKTKICMEKIMELVAVRDKNFLTSVILVPAATCH